MSWTCIRSIEKKAAIINYRLCTWYEANMQRSPGAPINFPDSIGFSQVTSKVFFDMSIGSEKAPLRLSNWFDWKIWIGMKSSEAVIYQEFPFVFRWPVDMFWKSCLLDLYAGCKINPFNVRDCRGKWILETFNPSKNSPPLEGQNEMKCSCRIIFISFQSIFMTMRWTWDETVEIFPVSFQGWSHRHGPLRWHRPEDGGELPRVRIPEGGLELVPE